MSRLMLVVYSAVFLALGTEASACPVCFSSIAPTPGQRIDGADLAVLALPNDVRNELRVIEVIKGDIEIGATIAQGSVTPLGNAAVEALGVTGGSEAALTGKLVLLVRNAMGEDWTSLGEIDKSYANWLRALSAHEQPLDRIWPPLTTAGSKYRTLQWTKRLLVAARHFESPERLAAEIAYGELEKAPYEAIRRLRPLLDPTKIELWMNDPALSSRFAGYTLLIGVSGSTEHENVLAQRIDQALQTGNSTNLSAMLVADLELRGAGRVSWIEQAILFDGRRRLQEIQAALMALSVHGGADARIPRARVIDAYCNFIKLRKPMAGFVARELADWQAWQATELYLDIIRTKAVKDPAGEFAILSYLYQSQARTNSRELPNRLPEVTGPHSNR